MSGAPSNIIFVLGVIDHLLQLVRVAQEEQRDIPSEDLDAQWARIQTKRAQFEVSRDPDGE